jgi:hypothetical protein
MRRRQIFHKAAVPDPPIRLRTCCIRGPRDRLTLHCEEGATYANLRICVPKVRARIRNARPLEYGSGLPELPLDRPRKEAVRLCYGGIDRASRAHCRRSLWRVRSPGWPGGLHTELRSPRSFFRANIGSNGRCRGEVGAKQVAAMTSHSRITLLVVGMQSRFARTRYIFAAATQIRTLPDRDPAHRGERRLRSALRLLVVARNLNRQ